MKHYGEEWVHTGMRHLFKGKRDPFHERDATYSTGQNEISAIKSMSSVLREHKKRIPSGTVRRAAQRWLHLNWMWRNEVLQGLKRGNGIMQSSWNIWERTVVQLRWIKW